MSYKNGKDVLPPNLLKQLQEYIQGEIVYIPKKEQKRAGWGENNGTRIIIERRNQEIFRLYQTGSTVIGTNQSLSFIGRQHPQNHRENARINSQSSLEAASLEVLLFFR